MKAAAALPRVLAAIDDLELRAHKATELLASLTPEEAARALGDWVRGAALGHADHSRAAEAAQRGLHAGLVPAELQEELRAAALHAKDDQALSLLCPQPAARTFDRGEPGYVDREMTSRTLGERKQLARSLDRDLLARLAHDRDPEVLRQLLENPRVTEREALIAASRRPTHGAVLEQIFRSRRFSSNRRVRKALALNPYCPPALAAAALSLLTGPELREVAQDSHLRDEVRGHAERLLALRAGKEG